MNKFLELDFFGYKRFVVLSLTPPVGNHSQSQAWIEEEDWSNGASNPFPVKPLIARETISNIQRNQKSQHEDDGNFMKVLDESRKEVQRPIHAKILSAKSTTRIGTWNVWTLYQCGKLAQLCKEFGNYRMDIMGISEMRWTGSGKLISDGKTVFYSGHEDLHIRGVGLMLNKEAAQALTGWKPVSERIITARFQSTYMKTIVIQVYAPTEEAEECDKDAFYEQLQDTINEIPSHDVRSLIGDLNAQICADRQRLEQIIGPHGTATQTNDSGDRLLPFCNTNGLCIGNKYFVHKTIHKKTWRSPDGVNKNEIDYICINNRWRAGLSDVRVYRGADIGSDHHLLMSTYRLRLKRKKECKPIRPIAVEELKDTTIAEQFKIKLENQLQLLQNAVDIEDQWTGFKNTVIEVAEETIGRRRSTQKERWIQNRTWQLIDETKVTKSQKQQEKSEEEKGKAASKYRRLDKTVKRNYRSDKKA